MNQYKLYSMPKPTWRDRLLPAAILGYLLLISPAVIAPIFI